MKLAGLDVAFDRGRIGHGIGLLLTEPPHIGPYDHTVLEPNMVLAIEPGIVTDYGTFNVEENVRIMESGEPEILTPSPPEILDSGF